MATFMISMMLLFVWSATSANSQSCIMVAANNITYLAIADRGEAGILILDSNGNAFACAAGTCSKLANLVTLAAS
jgi:hypothetical protein